MNDRGNLFNFSDALQMLAFRRAEAKKPDVDIDRIRDLKIAFNLTEEQWRLWQKKHKDAKKVCGDQPEYGWKTLNQTHSLICDLLYN